MEPLTPETLLLAYANGYFPMATSQDSAEVEWFHPSKRGILPLDDFNIPRGLKRVMKSHHFAVTVDTAFREVMEACAEQRPERKETWINQTIIDAYCQLHRLGHAHSVEVWDSEKLVGGLYGVSLGGAFFGESMFSRASEASKIALVTLVEILREAGYRLLDTQYVNAHLTQFGVQAISRQRYMTKLEKALNASPNPSSLFSTVSVRRGFASLSSES
ncbi:MAG: leucyl/phenylalanyl-tRNA--protein transferase [Rickettsiales bacterium]